MQPCTQKRLAYLVFQAVCAARGATISALAFGYPDPGATIFPERGLSVQPSRGDALVFFPTLMDGRLNPHALHAAEEVCAYEGSQYTCPSPSTHK